MLEKLIVAGMDIARFNMCHTVKASQIADVKMLRTKHGKDTKTAMDTKGPDVRIGKFKDGKVDVVAGQEFKFYFGEENKGHMGTDKSVFVPYEKLLTIVKVGSQLCLNDGHVIMDITNITGKIITAVVVAGGVLKDNKSLAAPGYDLQLPFISPEDEEDFKFGIECGVDMIMASAVSKAQDVLDIRAFFKANGGDEKIFIISKIEDKIGVSNLDAIIRESDGVMVARGGLGTDVGIVNLPPLQKLIIEKTRKAGKMIINATEMLESMTDKPNPTRAEVTDVANAVWDGASHVMLSGETAAGKYPIETVEYMKKTAEVAEAHPQYFRKF